MRRRRSWKSARSALALLAWLHVGCQGAPDAPATPAPAVDPPRAASETVATTPVATTPAADRPTVVFLGDSLTAGFGLGASQAFPALVARSLEAAGRDVKVVNAGVSGDTTAGGLRRLDWLLRQTPDLVVVALGGNDGLRGVDLADTEANLRAIVEGALDAGAQVILAGMLIPPNYGPDYTEQFAGLYPALAEELGVALIPFLLDGVAGDPSLNQADGIHPTAEGQQRVAELVLPYVEAALATLDP